MVRRTIDEYQLAQDVIKRFGDQQGVHPCFEQLLEANSGLATFSTAKVKIAVYSHNEHTAALVQRLEDVFESVYGKRPKVTVYVPYVPSANPASGET